MEASSTNGELPAPPSEQVHLPGPSFLPVVVAAGVTIALVGLVVSLYLVPVGAVILLVALTRWIRSAREDIAGLPLEG